MYSAMLKQHLDAFLFGFKKETRVAHDPVRFVRQYDDPRDREVAGLITSAFSYGNVKRILESVELAFSFLGPARGRGLYSLNPQPEARGFGGFFHRFNPGRDLAALFWMIRRALEEYGSLENAFLRGMPDEACDTGEAIGRFGAL